MRRRMISELDEHPNLPEILGVLGQLPHVTDGELRRLAEAWRNPVAAADARARALSPDVPLVVEVLAAFDAVQTLFADDITGSPDFPTVEPAVAVTALKAIRDAIAAAYARPVLGRVEYATLIRAWRAVYPVQQLARPDLGPQAARVQAVLGVLPQLAGRCHDDSAAQLFAELDGTACMLDQDLREAARDETWRAAVLTSRRRVWELVRRNGMAALGRYCTRCRRRPGGSAEARVLELCLDAACALLVSDAVDDTLVEVLTLPLGELIPQPRPCAD